jgi:sulfite reductase (NADPH) hemoprotein beta-component
MYRYDAIDKTLVAERVAQFRDQTRRFLTGELSDDEFRHLRLRNGLYLQRHAPMLRVAIPYGLLSSEQLRMLASIAVTVTSRPGKTSNTTGPRSRTYPTSWPTSPASRCTRSRPAATAFAM